MSSNSSGKKLEGFFSGKGFYIVLLLCAAVVGVSAWMMAAGDETMANDPIFSSNHDNRRVETVIIPAQQGPALMPETDLDLSEAAPSVSTEGLAEPVQPVDSQNETKAVEASAPNYVWPLEGELERAHSTTELHYDVTMRDWRTHEGIDILAEHGATVRAAHGGVVSDIHSDDLYGTVLTVDHLNGTKTVYANLAETPAVNVGQWVEPGDVIGSVGATALCEIGQQTHLHFAVEVDGVSADPTEYLPG